MIGVYAIVHRDSGRRYIGSSKCVEKRWGQHLNLLTHGRHHSPYLQHAWTKYGAEAFDFVVVEQCAQQELLSRKQAWIDWSRSLRAAEIVARLTGRKSKQQEQAHAENGVTLEVA